MTVEIPTDPAALPGLPDRLAGRFDESLPAPFAAPRASLESLRSLSFRRLGGAARRDGRVASSVPSALLAGLSATGSPFAWVVSLRRGRCAVLAGALPERIPWVAGALHAMMGGPLPSGPPADVELSGDRAWGALQGIPSSASALAIADTLLDAAHGEDLTYLVYAAPEPVALCRERTGHLRAAVDEVERRWLRHGAQGELDRAAIAARDAIDAWIQRSRGGESGSLWRVSALVSSARVEVTRMALAVLAGAFQEGEAPTLAPVRGALCGPAGGRTPHSNVLTAPELAALCVAPARDRHGYAVSDETRFDVDPPAGDEGTVLGVILDGERATEARWVVPDDAWTRHLLVAGHTGSGKSTTVRSILSALAARGVPFLVLEPAKGEYAALAHAVDGLRVLRAGRISAEGDGEVPFRLNPFAFAPGFPLHTHIDLVTRSFVASFGMMPPAPFLLEEAIRRAYAARGWRMETGEHPDGWDALAFPTLSDLLEQVDGAVRDAGYDREVERNLRGALRTRVGNLCHGPKGFALDTCLEVPAGLLFGAPAVLDLRHLGSDEEKAFVMGVVLTRLYEQREVEGARDGALRHVLVLEEAHRLLRAAPERSAEEGNMGQHAVLSFANLIAEVRAYGQAVFIVDQLPTRLAPEASKQTGVKLVHRLPPRDDRDVVGDAMTLSDAQKQALARLPRGDAVAYAEGMDGALRVRMAGGTTRSSRPWATGAEHRPALDALVRSAARARWGSLLEAPEVRRSAEGVLWAALEGSPPGPPREALRRAAQTASGARRDPPSADGLSRAALESAVWRRGRAHGWSSRDVAGVEAALGEPGGPGSALRVALERRRRPCGCRAEGCLRGYETGLVTRDPGFREALAAAARPGAPGEWTSLVYAAARAAVHAAAGRAIDAEGACACVMALADRLLRGGPATRS
ncbi:MAG: DUF87 domain-containing protein [Deltaproteobacteria bacterium]|nr:DUF87 domain-containing protein [Myxococcales bacterium]MDP3216477.1 DUF87 domain-containing protein [Deltaproteobacteria bacterium]